MTVYHLRKLYREQGIRKKKIKKTKIISAQKHIELREQAIFAEAEIRKLE